MQNHSDKERFPCRKHPRLKNFNYASPNYYFITICTWNKACIFGKAGALNQWGIIARDCLLEIEHHFSNVYIDQFVIMPNHIHMIVVLQGDGANLSDVIGLYKSSVTRKIRQEASGQKIWQTSFHDHVIRSPKAYEMIWLYIDANPLNWEKDCFFQEI